MSIFIGECRKHECRLKGDPKFVPAMNGNDGAWEIDMSDMYCPNAGDDEDEIKACRWTLNEMNYDPLEWSALITHFLAEHPGAPIPRGRKLGMFHLQSYHLSLHNPQSADIRELHSMPGECGAYKGDGDVCTFIKGHGGKHEWES